MIALLLAASITVQPPLAGDSMEVSVHRLSNGLTVYLSPNKQEPRIAAQIAVRAGSKHDPSDSTGMAHYLEHMLFKGSKRLGTVDYSKEKPHLDKIVSAYERLFGVKDPSERKKLYTEIDRENIQASKYAVPNEIDKAYRVLGVRGLNAYTSDEMTVYVSNLPSNRLEAWAKLEADRFSDPVFRLFQSELETVYEEKNRSLDNAERLLSDAMDAALYKRHPYGQQPTLGSIEHLKNPSLKKMYAYFDAWYRPNNMAVILAGDFERQAALAALEKQLGSWKAKPLQKPASWPLPAPTGVERLEVKYEAEEKVVVAWPTVAYGHPEEPAIIVLDMIMDNSAAGLINLRLNQAQRVKRAGSYPSFMNDAGAWYLWALPKQGQTLEEAEKLLLETVEALKNGEFSDDDVRAVITDFEIAEKQRLESNESRAHVMAASFLRFEPWPVTAARLDALRMVTKAQVVAAAKKHLGGGRVVGYRRNGKPVLPSVEKPSFTKIDMDPSRQSAYFAEIVNTPAPPIEPRWLQAGLDYTVAELPEGRLYVAPNPFNDLFSISWRFELGWRHRRQLCAAAELFELSGGGDLPAEEYKRKLYALGSSVSMGCGEQNVSVTITGLEKNLWKTLELLRLRFERPHVAPGTLQKLVEIQLGAQQDNKRDPGYVHHALGELALHGADSSVLQELSPAELRALDEKRLLELLRELWSYRRRVAYVGTREGPELARLIADGRTSWSAPPKRRPEAYVKPGRDRVLFAHRDMVQAQVGLAAADEQFDAEKSVDYQMFSSYMGGGMSAVLFQEIREARSLAYSAGGGYSPGQAKGDENLVYGSLGCQADKTVDAARLLAELFRRPPLTEKRFAETKKALEQNYRTNPINFRSVPGVLMTWEDQGITGGDPRPRRFQRLLGYSGTELESFSARMKEKAFTLYVLSHRDRVDLAGLKSLGAFEEKKLEELFPY